jgi:hypothetical protein
MDRRAFLLRILGRRDRAVAEGGNFDPYRFTEEDGFYRREPVPMALWRGMRFCQSK